METLRSAPSPSAPPDLHRDRLRALVSKRLDRVPSWALVTQLFIGMGWLRAATEKVIDPFWWRGENLLGFIEEHRPLTVGWYRPFVDLVVEPYAVVIGVIVIVAQLFAGTALITGQRMKEGLAVGLFLNLNFVAAGAVNPSAFYLVCQGALALWLAERARRSATLDALRGTSLVAAMIGVLSLPFVSTLHPAEVIDDPAIMLVTASVLTVVGCDLAHRNLTGSRGS